MQTPSPNAHYSKRIDFGSYVERRLRTAKRTTLAADVQTATDEVLKCGRALEDAGRPVQQALADRDGADDDLDAAAQEARNNLAGRGVGADRKPTYTLTFPYGIGYYTAAPLDKENERYTELKKRLEENLPEDDAVRTNTVTAIDKGLTEFGAATTAVSAARTDEALASTKLDAAEDAWDRLMEKAYGVLVAELGRARAERFFPKIRSRRKKKTTEETPE
jgi:hypothetical protein